jgi:hypothetical protein
MAELLHEYSTRMAGPDGTEYIVRSYGEQRADGTWAGWIEFEPTAAFREILRTGQETSQPNRTAVEYWATGLEPIYFEGAFERAKDTSH